MMPGLLVLLAWIVVLSTYAIPMSTPKRVDACLCIAAVLVGIALHVAAEVILTGGGG